MHIYISLSIYICIIYIYIYREREKGIYISNTFAVTATTSAQGVACFVQPAGGGRCNCDHKYHKPHLHTTRLCHGMYLLVL